MELNELFFDPRLPLVEYLFLVSCLIFIYVKLNQSPYFITLFEFIFIGSSKFGSSIPKNLANTSSLLLQITFVTMVGIGLSYYIDHHTNLFVFLKTILILAAILGIQVAGSYFFSSLTNQKITIFPRYRLALNEISSLFLFLTLFFVVNFSLDISFIILYILVTSALFNMIGSAIYLVKLISNFHIILYLCILEITPVLLIIKFI